MIAVIIRLIRASPFGPLAAYLYRLCALQHADTLHSRNAAYDRETLEVMKRVLGRNSCCIDIGAHQGSILREMLRIAPDGSHYAFEPLPHLADYLRKTFPTVQVHEAAVSDRAGKAQFIHVKNAPGYSGLRPRIYDHSDPILEQITVSVVCLDDVIPNHQAISFIKLDIEGGEYHALAGSIHTICRCRPFVVLEAGQKSTGQYGVRPEDLYRLISEMPGYRLSTMKRWLAGAPPLSLPEFNDSWYNDSDYYFIAYPKRPAPAAG